MPCGVDVILGMNGYVWVSKHIQENRQEGEEGFDAEAVYSNVNDVRPFPSLPFPLLLINPTVYRPVDPRSYITRYKHHHLAGTEQCPSDGHLAQRRV